MTCKTSKTILFASLIVAMILPFSAMNHATAQMDENNDEERMVKYQQKLQEMREKAIRENKIYGDELVERVGKHWIDQYNSKEEFEYYENNLKYYVEYELPQNGWNPFMQKQNILINNYDTMIEKKGYGFEIVALLSELEKIQGNYNHSKQVMKFHEWTIQQFDIPNTEEAIEERLVEITGDAKYRMVTDEVYRIFNGMAEYGNVHRELIKKDPKYWGLIIHIGVCQLDDECDGARTYNMLENQLHKTENSKEIPHIVQDMIQEWVDSILQKAFAITQISHRTTMFGEPEDCNYGTCRLTDEMVGIGEHNLHVEVPLPPNPHVDFHAFRTTLEISMTSCPTFEVPFPADTIHSVSMTITKPRNMHFTHADYGCAYIHDTVRMANNPKAPWIWAADGWSIAWGSSS
jgi:hypothetical protein